MHLKNKNKEFNFWPSVADMILASSIVFLLLWFTENLRSQLLIAENNKLKKEVEMLKKDKPPIINLDEASGYTFDSGSAKLSPQFELALKDKVIPKLTQVINEYNVDVIEVIGHTDRQVVSGRSSNLDFQLLNVIQDQANVESLVYGSNSDLGLIRALSVAKFIKSNAGTKLMSVKYRYYSAAQGISPAFLGTGQIADSDARLRRIEIRFTRLSNER